MFLKCVPVPVLVPFAVTVPILVPLTFNRPVLFNLLTNSPSMPRGPAKVTAGNVL